MSMACSPRVCSIAVQSPEHKEHLALKPHLNVLVAAVVSQLMDDEATRKHFPADTVKRAKEYLDAIGSTGAYTESQGAEIFRQQIAAVCPPAD